MLQQASRALESSGVRRFSTSCPARELRTAHLDNRALLGVRGRDAPKFLQGLVSNDVFKVGSTSQGKQALLFAAVLKPDGRMLHDIFIHADPTATADEPAFWLELEAAHVDGLRKYLKRHILRSKVKLVPAQPDQTRVMAAWSTDKSDDVSSWESFCAAQGIGRDTRAPDMGWRWVADSTKHHDHDGTHHVDASYHHLHRLLSAVPEGEADWSSLPLESNLDLMGGVDYKKGCYVGQELTARTHHRGVVRKRGVVVRLFHDGEDEPSEPLPTEAAVRPAPGMYSTPQPGQALVRDSTGRARARTSGRLGSTLPVLTDRGSTITLGFASLRLEQIPSSTFTIAKADIDESGTPDAATVEAGVPRDGDEGQAWRIKAFVPSWLQAKLDKESAA